MRLNAKLLKKATGEIDPDQMTKDLRAYLAEIDPECAEQLISQEYSTMIFYPQDRHLHVKRDRVEKEITLKGKDVFNAELLVRIFTRMFKLDPETYEIDPNALNWDMDLDQEEAYLGHIYNNRTGQNAGEVSDFSGDSEMITFTSYQVWIGNNVRNREGIMDWLVTKGGALESGKDGSCTWIRFKGDE
jgi:hypothetical protein